MHLTLYITDPWCALSTADPRQHVEQVLSQSDMFSRADWTLQTTTLASKLFTDLFASGTSNYVALLRPAEDCLCLLPVHLALQRDTFSLQQVVKLPAVTYALLTQTLSTHFSEDFTLVQDAAQRCWWIRPKQALAVQVPWPLDCMYQQAFAWQPQGRDAGQLRAWTNEIQMLLHQLASTHAQADWPDLLNSLWFAHDASALPPMQSAVRFAGQGSLFDAMQRHSPAQALSSLADIASHDDGPVSVIADTLADVCWEDIRHYLQLGKIQHVRLRMPYAGQHVEAVWQAAWRWQCWKPQFWRKPHTAASLLQALSAQLNAQIP